MNSSVNVSGDKPNILHIYVPTSLHSKSDSTMYKSNSYKNEFALHIEPRVNTN